MSTLLAESRRIKSLNLYLIAPVGVCSEVGGIIFFLNSYQVITCMKQKKSENLKLWTEQTPLPLVLGQNIE